MLFFLRFNFSQFDALKLSERAACCLISWFLEEPAVAAYSTSALSGVISAVRKTVTWPLIVKVFIEGYLKNVVLGDAYARVTTAHQRDVDPEEEFGNRLEFYAGVCSGILKGHILIKYVLRGLLPTAAAVRAIQVHQLSPRDLVSFSIPRRTA